MRIVFCVMAAVLAQQAAASSRTVVAQPPAAASKAALDYEYFKTQVQPVFLVKRAGYTRCVVCHVGGGEPGFCSRSPPAPPAGTRSSHARTSRQSRASSCRASR